MYFWSSFALPPAFRRTGSNNSPFWVLHGDWPPTREDHSSIRDTVASMPLPVEDADILADELMYKDELRPAFRAQLSSVQLGNLHVHIPRKRMDLNTFLSGPSVWSVLNIRTVDRAALEGRQET